MEKAGGLSASHIQEKNIKKSKILCFLTKAAGGRGLAACYFSQKTGR